VRQNAVAHGDLRYAGAQRCHLAGRFDPEGVREEAADAFTVMKVFQRNAAVLAAAQLNVVAIDAAGTHPQQNLARARDGRRHLVEAQLLDGAESVEACRSHALGHAT
jgi:hypothetical protein